MSGGGSSGTSRPNDNGGAGNENCDIVERTNLNSPNPAVVASLNVGDILFISLNLGPPKRVEAQDSSGQVAGTITSAALARLIRCLESGVAFEAEVLVISGGKVEVELRPA